MINPKGVCGVNQSPFTTRNETYCVTGSIRLQVYQADSVDIYKLSYHFSAFLGHSKNIVCPSLDDFNKTEGLISWDKVREQRCLVAGWLGCSSIEHQKNKTMKIKTMKFSYNQSETTV